MTKIQNLKPVYYTKNQIKILYDKTYFHHENTKF
jgi:hypothetical protein